MSRAPNMRVTLEERFWLKVNVRGSDDCWLWTGCVSRSGRREVDYGCIREGGRGSRLLRANRLALLLKTAPVDCPRDPDESFVDWLRRANRWRDHLEAAHTCDVSLCCNPKHLEWQTHAENVTAQRVRRQSAASTFVEQYAVAVLVFVALFLGAGSARAHADELDPHPRIFGALIAGAVSLQIVGLHQTKTCISAGTCHESWPMMAPLSGNLAALGAVKGVTFAAVNTGIWSLHRKHPRIAFALLAAEVGVHALDVAHNHRVLSTARR